jgi:dolichol-phosphate mannosyltransferase
MTNAEPSHANTDLPIVIPVLNEEDGIGPTLKEINDTFAGTPLKPACYVVDGNSTDNTLAVAQSMEARIIQQNGKGKGNALSEAFRALPKSVKYVVIIDGDYTYPARHILKMLRAIAANPKIGMVTGNRFAKRFNLQWAKNPYYAGNRLLAAAHYLLNKIHMRDPLTGLRILRYDLVKDWTPKSQGFDIEVELNAHIEKSGYEILETPIKYRHRLGHKKLHVRHGICILYRIICEAFPSMTLPAKCRVKLSSVVEVLTGSPVTVPGTRLLNSRDTRTPKTVGSRKRVQSQRIAPANHSI